MSKISKICFVVYAPKLTTCSLIIYLNCFYFINSVHVKVRRIGGGFGGKLSRSSQVSTACALVAKKMNVPCRFILPLQTNLTISGRRLPCQTEYEVNIANVSNSKTIEIIV